MKKYLSIFLFLILIMIIVFTSCRSQVYVEVRSIGGFGNNLEHPMWGGVGQQERRVTSVAYSDLISAPAGDMRPNSRVISNALCAQPISVLDENGLSDFVWAWGQFIVHDTVLSMEQGAGELFDIAVPAGDPWFDPDGTGDVTLSLTRSIFDPLTGTGSTNPRQQLNMISSWIDGSMVYGSDLERAAWLRTYEDGRLKVETNLLGDLMPFNDGTLTNVGGMGTNLFAAGGPRANVSTNLIVLHTLFVREHNRLADEIANEHPDWSDEQIYQKARSIVIGELQVITYNEFLPAMLGEGALNEYNGYDASIDPSTLNAFSGVAFRLGHSQLGSQFLLLGEDGNEIPEGHLAMEDAFFNPEIVIEQGLDPVLRGLAANVQEATDLLIVDGIRNAFQPPNKAATDVIALDIQRGRDHGLPDYNHMRQDFDLKPVTAFNEISSDITIQRALESVYGSVDNIDPLIGMLAEDHLPGTCFGELASIVIKQQYEATRDGDRFWYTNDPNLTNDEISQIEKTLLSDIILRNTNITDIQQNVFFAP